MWQCYKTYKWVMNLSHLGWTCEIWLHFGNHLIGVFTSGKPFYYWNSVMVIWVRLNDSDHQGQITISKAKIDLLYKSYSALVPYPTMHHFVTRMCTHVHIRVTKYYIVRYLPIALQGSWDGSIAINVLIPLNRKFASLTLYFSFLLCSLSNISTNCYW